MNQNLVNIARSVPKKTEDILLTCCLSASYFPKSEHSFVGYFMTMSLACIQCGSHTYWSIGSSSLHGVSCDFSHTSRETWSAIK